MGHGDGRRVAVIGGGPAGLACAHDLAVLGYRVKVLEASHQLGGMMRQGIPIYRLSRDLLELEIGAIRGLGVDIELGQGLHGGRTLRDLRAEGYEAVFLATGAGRGRHLDVEGAQLDGVVLAIDYLLNANQGYRVSLGTRVVVVGAGTLHWMWPAPHDWDTRPIRWHATVRKWMRKRRLAPPFPAANSVVPFAVASATCM